MSRLVFTPRARSDLDEIWLYTVRRWSAQQAADYLSSLGHACDDLVGDPSIGRPCDGIRPGLRRLRVGSHVIFYRVRGQTVVVVRILHERMDFDRHL